jgi:hypothetical protein
MVEVKCDRWTCKHFQNDFCTAIEVNLETQGNNDLCCLTFENYDPKVTKNSARNIDNEESCEALGVDNSDRELMKKNERT